MHYRVSLSLSDSFSPNKNSEVSHLIQLMDVGMAIARFNMSHGTKKVSPIQS